MSNLAGGCGARVPAERVLYHGVPHQTTQQFRLDAVLYCRVVNVFVVRYGVDARGTGPQHVMLAVGAWRRDLLGVVSLGTQLGTHLGWKKRRGGCGHVDQTRLLTYRVVAVLQALVRPGQVLSAYRHSSMLLGLEWSVSFAK